MESTNTPPPKEPITGPWLRRLRSWRRLPLSAQLIAIGLVVSLTWFFTARGAAGLAAEAQRERTTRLDVLHQAELSAVRMLANITTMQASYRGFLLSGDAEMLERYEQARRGIESDVAGIQPVAESDMEVRNVLARLVTVATEWDADVVQTLGAARRGALVLRVGPGTAMADSVAKRQRTLVEFRAIHGQLVRAIRANVIRVEAEAETAAALDEWESFLLRAAAVAIFALFLVMLLRLVSQSLNSVVIAAEALDAGNYQEARLPNAHRAPNEEMARLARTFDRLAHSIEERERQLQEDIEKLKELERLKADFVSTVSHELRTPLTSMRGALGLLLSGAGGDLSPKGRDLLRIALTNTDRLIRLINDILDIEKIDAGHVEIRRDRIRLRAVLDSTIAGLEGLSREADVRLELVHVDDVEVIGDADRLTQVFTNLISNAVKFSPKGSSVDISIVSEGNAVRVGVRDHGPGIPAEFASRIFGRFQQAQAAESRRPGGTGLGLSIAKSITELHAGRIGFRSPEGGGTEFYVDLAVAPRPTSEVDQRPRVLIVEDDESMRDVLCALMEPFCQPVPATDAESAWRILEQVKIRIAVLDTGLPGMDGLAFARRLRKDERFRTLSVLVYSASDFTPQDLKDSGVRISDAFVKTRDPESALVARVRRELQGAI